MDAKLIKTKREYFTNRFEFFYKENRLKEGVVEFNDEYEKHIATPNLQQLLGSFYVRQLILNCEYVEAEKVSQAISESTENWYSYTSISDAIYAKSLIAYHLGYFHETIKCFFPSNVSPYLLNGNKKLPFHASPIFNGHINMPEQMGQNHLLLGKAYWKLGHYPQALLHYFLALDYFDLHLEQCGKESFWIAKIYNLIGLVYLELSNHENLEMTNGLSESFYIEKAKNCLLFARDYLDTINGLNPNTPAQLADLKWCHLRGCIETDLGRLSVRRFNNKKDSEKDYTELNDAENFFRSAEKLFKKVYVHKPKCNRYYASILFHQGEMAFARGQLINAKQFFTEDLRIRTKDIFPNIKKNNKIKKGHHPTIGRTYNKLALIYLKQWETEKKANYLEKGLYNSHMAIHSVVRGFKFTKKLQSNKNWCNPEFNFKKQRKTLEGIQTYAVFLDAIYLKLQMLLKLDIIQYRKLIQDTLDFAFKVIDLIRDEVSKGGELSDFALGSKVKPIFELGLFFYLNAGKYKKENEMKIFQIIEKSKNYSLLQSIRKDEINIKDSDVIINSLVENFLNVNKSLTGEKLIDALASQYYEDLDQIEQNKVELKRLVKKLRKKNKKLKNTPQPPVVDLEDIQTKMGQIDDYGNQNSYNKDLRKQTMIISYFWGEEGIYYQRITSTNVRSGQLNTNIGYLKYLIKSYLDDLNGIISEDNIGSLDFLNYAEPLYDILIDQLDISEKINFLIIFPDKFLYHLPFDVLVKPKDVTENPRYFLPRYLALDYYVTYHFSVSFLFHSLNSYKQSQIWNSQFTGIASNYSLKAVSKDEDIQRIFIDLMQKVAIVDNQAKSKVFIYSKDASLLNEKNVFTIDGNIELIRESLKNTQLLIVGNHSNRSRTGLILTENVKISLKDIQIESIGLVYLASCFSGAGEVITVGEGNMSLSRFFSMKQGVRNVIHNLIAVPYAFPKEGAGMEQEFFENFFKIPEHDSISKIRPAYAVALTRTKRNIIKNFSKDGFSPEARFFIAGPAYYGSPIDYFI